MCSLRRKMLTKALTPGVSSIVTIAILGPLLVAAGCRNENAAERAFERGNSYAEEEDFESAIAAYTEAIRLRPDYAEAYGNRGNAYDEQGETTRPSPT